MAQDDLYIFLKKNPNTWYSSHDLVKLGFLSNKPSRAMKQLHKFFPSEILFKRERRTNKGGTEAYFICLISKDIN